jgi:hypothetical protein
MIYASRGSHCRKLATIAFAAAAIAVGACSTNEGSSTSPLANHAAERATTLTWATWVTVTPSPQASTIVTGINNLTGANGPEIVGFYTVKTNTSTSGRGFSYSFTSIGKSYSAYTTASYPLVQNGTQPYRSLGTQMNSIATQSSGLPILAGWVSNPGNQCQIWPVVDNQGLWGLEDVSYSGGTKTMQTTAELFGINDENIAVGYDGAGLTTGRRSCQSPTKEVAAFFLTSGKPVLFDLSSLGTTITNSVANGIDDNGDMVGTYTIGSGTSALTYSWYALCLDGGCASAGGTKSSSASYCIKTLQDGGSSNTTAYAISGPVISGGTETSQIAGSYFDSADNATHGFVVPVTKTSGGVCSSGVFQDIKEPNAVHGTVVRGINDADYIVGYYIDGNHHQDGFVGIPGTAPNRRRPPRLK